jgi:hypothetical protein
LRFFDLRGLLFLLLLLHLSHSAFRLLGDTVELLHVGGRLLKFRIPDHKRRVEMNLPIDGDLILGGANGRGGAVSCKAVKLHNCAEHKVEEVKRVASNIKEQTPARDAWLVAPRQVCCRLVIR